MTRVILNALVKNEAARIERMLRSVAPHIVGAVLLDTGSTDDTLEVARRVLRDGSSGLDAGEMPLGFYTEPFVDFSTSRNRALEKARQEVTARFVPMFNAGESWYLLLCDADMELVAAPGAFDNLSAPAYMIEQRGEGLSYANTRLVRADVVARYKGRTHEYLSVEGAIPLPGVYFIDHADGANRPGKLERDIDLLLLDMQDDPTDPRPVFYIANTYRELGMHGLAASYYDKRIAMGGWDEEVYVSKLYAARCRLSLGDDGAGVAGLLAAHAHRPSRAEPLYSLARHYREKPDMQATAVMFANAGIAIPQPPDTLFVEADVYRWALRQERSIAGFYVPKARDTAFADTEWLATSRDVPEPTRWEARRNLLYWTKPLEEVFPSARRTRIEFPCDEGWAPMNSSILRHKGGMALLMRTVNFTVDRVSGAYSMPEGVTQTRNFLCLLHDNYQISVAQEIVCDPPLPVAYPWVLGAEDMRLFEDAAGDLWASCTARQLASDGLCEIVIGRIVDGRFADWRIISDRAAGRNEKNVVPIIGQPFKFLYLHDPFTVVDAEWCKAVTPTNLAVDHWRGSSQLIPFDGGYLSVEHEVVEGMGVRKYLHRVVAYDLGGVRAYSRPFHFAPLADTGNQFCAGMCYNEDESAVHITYSLNDESAWLATVSMADIRRELGI